MEKIWSAKLSKLQTKLRYNLSMAGIGSIGLRIS